MGYYISQGDRQYYIDEDGQVYGNELKNGVLFKTVAEMMGKKEKTQKVHPECPICQNIFTRRLDYLAHMKKHKKHELLEHNVDIEAL